MQWWRKCSAQWRVRESWCRSQWLEKWVEHIVAVTAREWRQYKFPVTANYWHVELWLWQYRFNSLYSRLSLLRSFYYVLLVVGWLLPSFITYIVFAFNSFSYSINLQTNLNMIIIIWCFYLDFVIGVLSQ